MNVVMALSVEHPREGGRKTRIGFVARPGSGQDFIRHRWQVLCIVLLEFRRSVVPRGTLILVCLPCLPASPVRIHLCHSSVFLVLLLNDQARAGPTSPPKRQEKNSDTFYARPVRRTNRTLTEYLCA